MEKMFLELRIDIKKDNLSMMKKFDAVVGDTEQLRKEVAELRRNQHDTDTAVSSIDTKQQIQDGAVDSVVRDVENLREQVKILHNVVRKHDQINLLSELQDERQKLNSVRNNLLISGMDEVAEEDQTATAELVTDLFSQSMKMGKKIELTAERIGKATPRTVLVKLKNSQDKAEIFKHAKELKNIRNNKDGEIYVNSQLPPKLQEQKRWYRYLIKFNANQTTGKRNLTIKNGNLMVDGGQFFPAVVPPGTGETVFPLDERHVNAMKLHKGHDIKYGRCSFVGYSVLVRNIGDVRAAYTKVRRMNAEALSVVCGYRLPGLDFVHLRGCADDNEHGAGRCVYFTLENADVFNRAVFVVRRFGNKHLGPIRFKLIKDAAESAMGVHSASLPMTVTSRHIVKMSWMWNKK